MGRVLVTHDIQGTANSGNIPRSRTYARNFVRRFDSESLVKEERKRRKETSLTFFLSDQVESQRVRNGVNGRVKYLKTERKMRREIDVQREILRVKKLVEESRSEDDGEPDPSLIGVLQALMWVSEKDNVSIPIYQRGKIA